MQHAVWYHPIKNEIMISTLKYPYFEYETFNKTETFYQWVEHEPLTLGYEYIGEL